MFVYLKDGSKRRWVADVHLKDGFCPCIGSSMSDKRYVDALRMEPAIWFKVLVLESVSVDCGKRVVSWSTKSADEDSDSSTKNSFYGEGECYDYNDDTDELFRLAQQVMNRTSEERENSTTADNDYEPFLLRMLHCYILPKITLHIEDLEKVNQALEKQLQHIQVLDCEVVNQCKAIDECMARLSDDRSRFLPDLEVIIGSHQCSKGFLDILMEDVKKEECKLRDEVNQAQNCVQDAKEVCVKNSCSRTEERLLQARRSRDELQSKLVPLLNYREIIKSALPQVANVGGVAVGHDLLHSYLHDREQLRREKDCRNRMLEQKNCALSVREMLEGAKGDLKKKGFTEANEANAQGLRPSDVLQGVWHPEWQKLGERVATIVNNEEHPVGRYFLEFCRGLRSICQELIDLGRRAALPSDYIAVTCKPFGHSPCNQAKSSYEAYGLEDFMVATHREKLKELQNEIFSHLHKATELLADSFNNHGTQFKNKLRLCYEQCFYDREHTFLECVYELAHYEHIETLEQDVRRLKMLPIKLLDLQMKEEWWLRFFDQRGHLGSLTSQTLQPLSETLRRNGFLGQGGLPEGLEESYDMISDFIECLDDVTEESGDSSLGMITDVDQLRSMCIDVIRNSSRTFHDEIDEQAGEKSDAVDTPRIRSFSEATALSTSAPPLSSPLTLADVRTICERQQGQGTMLKRRLSKSSETLTRKPGRELGSEDNPQKGDTFEDHFGPSLQNIRDIFKASSPLAKLKCLTSSLRKITDAVQKLRMRDGTDSLAAAITADDLLPLLVLMLLQMEPWEVAVMWPQLCFMEDLMATFLASGCHGWALVEFQMAQRFLHKLCQEF